MIPNRFQKILKDSRKFQRVPKRFQRIPKESKRFQKIAKDSKDGKCSCKALNCSCKALNRSSWMAKKANISAQSPPIQRIRCARVAWAPKKLVAFLTEWGALTYLKAYMGLTSSRYIFCHRTMKFLQEFHASISCTGAQNELDTLAN